MRRIVRSLVVLPVLTVLAACVTATPTDLSVSTYRVSGTTERQLSRSLALHGPLMANGQRALASVDLRFVPAFEVDQRPGLCRLTDVSVGVKADVTVPEWRQRAQATGRLARNWDSFVDYALAHELEHVRIAQVHARRIEGAMLRARASDCDTLQARLSGEIDRILIAHDVAQQRFDAREQARIARLARRVPPGG